MWPSRGSPSFLAIERTSANAEQLARRSTIMRLTDNTCLAAMDRQKITCYDSEPRSRWEVITSSSSMFGTAHKRRDIK